MGFFGIFVANNHLLTNKHGGCHTKGMWYVFKLILFSMSIHVLVSKEENASVNEGWLPIHKKIDLCDFVMN